MNTTGAKTKCGKCGRPLAPDNITWLEFDIRTGEVTGKQIPEEFSQGCFPFGKDCAKTILSKLKESK